MSYLTLAAFEMSTQDMIVWLVIGLLGGSLAGVVVKRSKGGFGVISNLLFGLVGAFVGGAIFKALDFHTGLPSITIDLDDVAAAFVGALLVVIVVGVLNKRSKDGE